MAKSAAPVTDRTIPYELLIRWGDDALPRAAHMIYRSQTMIGDRVFETGLADPVPVQLADVQGIIEANFATALAQIDELAAAKKRIGELEQQLADALLARAQDAESSSAAVAALNGQAADLRAEVDRLNEAVDPLHQQIAVLKSAVVAQE